MTWLLTKLIRFYQRFLSPLKPPSCRFYPSCSAYALQAIQRFGPLKGGYLAIGRLLRCNPFNNGGVDYVPETWEERKNRKKHNQHRVEP